MNYATLKALEFAQEVNRELLRRQNLGFIGRAFEDSAAWVRFAALKAVTAVRWRVVRVRISFKYLVWRPICAALKFSGTGPRVNG